MANAGSIKIEVGPELEHALERVAGMTQDFLVAAARMEQAAREMNTAALRMADAAGVMSMAARRAG